jgi:uncharacterized protein (TIRG00374 family)
LQESAVKHFLRAVVSISLLALLAWRSDWTEIAGAFGQLHFELWLAAAGIYVLAQLLSACRWRQLAQPVGFQRTLKQYVGYYFISMFFSLFLPTSVGGDVVRALHLDQGSGRRLLAFSTVLMDRLSGLLVLLALAAVAIIACPLALPPWIKLCACSRWLL